MPLPFNLIARTKLQPPSLPPDVVAEDGDHRRAGGG